MSPDSSTWHVLHAFTVSSSVRFIGGQATALHPSGIRYTVCSTDGPELHHIAAAESVRTVAVPMLRRISPLADVVALLRLIRTIRREQPNAAHAHTPKAGLLLTVAAFLCRTPVRVYHVHGLPWSTARGLRRVLLLLSERVACALATHVLCVSASVKHALLQARLCDPQKAAILAGGSCNGVDAIDAFNRERLDPQAVRAIQARHRLPNDALLVGFVGRMVRDKGLVELTEAWQQVRKIVPQAYLLLVGPEEPEDPLPAKVRTQLQDDPRVLWHGAEWNVAPVFGALDLFVLPTYREGFPNVLLEAGAMRLPVVATRVDGCTDAVCDGETGTLIPARDVDALSAAMIRYLTNPELRRAHGDSARRRVEEGFSRQAVWQALHTFYRRVAPAGLVGEMAVEHAHSPPASPVHWAA